MEIKDGYYRLLQRQHGNPSRRNKEGFLCQVYIVYATPATYGFIDTVTLDLKKGDRITQNATTNSMMTSKTNSLKSTVYNMKDVNSLEKPL